DIVRLEILLPEGSRLETLPGQLEPACVVHGHAFEPGLRIGSGGVVISRLAQRPDLLLLQPGTYDRRQQANINFPALLGTEVWRPAFDEIRTCLPQGFDHTGQNLLHIGTHGTERVIDDEPDPVVFEPAPSRSGKDPSIRQGFFR